MRTVVKDNIRTAFMGNVTLLLATLNTNAQSTICNTTLYCAAAGLLCSVLFSTVRVGRVGNPETTTIVVSTSKTSRKTVSRGSEAGSEAGRQAGRQAGRHAGTHARRQNGGPCTTVLPFDAEIAKYLHGSRFDPVLQHV